MTNLRLGAALVAAALGIALSGCATASEQPTAAPTQAASATPTPTSTPEIPVPSALVLSLSSLAVLDQDGMPLQEIPFTDPDGMIGYFTGLFGADPVITDLSPKGIMKYEWEGVRVSTRYSMANLSFSAPDIAGLPARTAEGVHVGSSRGDVLALPHYEGLYDADGNGSVDWFGLQPREAPGTESLTYPGQPGTEFVGIDLVGDTVSTISAPSNDFGDV